MKETAAKRRDKAGGRDRDSKAEKPKEPKEVGPEPQDVEMPEEEAANAAKQPKEQDSLTLDGKTLQTPIPITPSTDPGTGSVLALHRESWQLGG